jgi:hypothetical protein
MSTAVAPVADSTGGSAAPITQTNTVTSDPIDSLDLSSLNSGVDTMESISIPESQIVGKRQDAAAAPDPAGKQRNADGTFAKAAEATADDEDDGEAKPTPFQYRSMGKTHDLEGATVDPAGNLVIPAAKIPEVQSAFNAFQMAKGDYLPTIQKWQARAAHLESQLKDRETAASVESTKAKTLVDSFAKAVADAKAANNPEAFLQFAYDLYGNWDLLMANAERDHSKAELERMRAAGKPAGSPQAPTTQPAAPSLPPADAVKTHTAEVIEHWKIDPSLRDVPAETWKQIEAKAAAQPYAYVRPATAEDAQKFPGVTVGQLVFDTDLLSADIDHGRKQRETALAQSKLVADNARRTQPTIQAPPTPGGGRSKPAPKKAGINSKSDWDEWLNSDTI